MAHTPGPWRINDDAKHDGWQARVSTPHGSIDCDESGDVVETDIANAHLVAAAPELLEALKQLAGVAAPFVGYGGSAPSLHNALASAKRVIAKAEGTA